MANIKDYEPLFGTFITKRFLGCGSFGEVYEVYDEELNEELKRAVKIIYVPDDAILEKIISEINTIMKIGKHENIARIENYAYSLNRFGGVDLFILMDLLTSLTKILNSKLPVEEIVKLGIHICSALETCASYKIVHGDIRPANILKGKDGMYKLTDFGARYVNAKMSPNSDAHEFQAPEVHFRRSDYDARSDIYSLGRTLYYLLNGNWLPFELHALLDSGITKDLSYILIKACESEPSARYQSARDMKKALEMVANRKDIYDNCMEYPKYWIHEVCERHGVKKIAVIHKSTCKFCSNKKSLLDNTYDDLNGKWHGTFENLSDAVNFADSIDNCKVCYCKVCEP